MPISADAQGLAQLKDFLAARDVELRETALPLIVPHGMPAAFAIDAEGWVVGFKFSRAPQIRSG